MTLCLTQLHTDPLAVNMLFSSARPEAGTDLADEGKTPRNCIYG